MRMTGRCFGFHLPFINKLFSFENLHLLHWSSDKPTCR